VIEPTAHGDDRRRRRVPVRRLRARASLPWLPSRSSWPASRTSGKRPTRSFTR